ncbi:choice-of-anchor A family protein [Nocardiopsis sp. HNM0947]|uniref:Choice-of-anchor A family protein n=1 Tax=Nocardiopsis coralli TaxID=2772213 RepID=A0ABR9P600_9ACTN|nr:collagen-binding domain-containing protein [Nocardiopsis coralli]MBE2999120.1 choice-of-anchor A family protein [Nocardiopsis coralli]
MAGRRCLAATAALSAGAVVAAPLFWGWGSGEAVAAETVNPVAPAQGFLAFSEGNTYLHNTESEGPIAVGGDLSFGSNYRVAIDDTGDFVDGDDARPTGLLVDGRIDFDASDANGVLQVLQNGYVKVGDTSGATIHDRDMNNAATNLRITPEGQESNSTPRVELNTQQPAASAGPRPGLIDFEEAFTQFRSYSEGFARCSTNATMTYDDGSPVDPANIPPGSSVHVQLVPGEQNVIDIPSASLNNITNLTFDDAPSESAPLLFNVDTSDTGGDFEWNAPNLAGASGQTALYTLYNFPGASRVTVPSDAPTIEGTIYAPDARVNHYSNGNIEGNVISREFVQDLGGPSQGSPARQEQRAIELHDFQFSAQLTTCDAEPTPSPTPTPPDVPTPTPPETPSPSPSPTPGPTPGPTIPPTPFPGPTPSPTPPESPTPNPTPSPTPPESPSPSPSPETPSPRPDEPTPTPPESPEPSEPVTEPPRPGPDGAEDQDGPREGDSSSLPVTGPEVLVPAAGGLIALLGGVAGLVLGRRRKDDDPA